MKIVVYAFVLLMFLITGCSNSGKSGYDKGLKYIEKGDVKKGIKCLIESSESGYADSSFKLSELYGDGKIVEPDERKSLNYLKASAEQGSITAQKYWGFALGSGVKGILEQDRNKSLYWLKQVLKSGDEEAKKEIAGIFCERVTVKYRLRAIKADGVERHAVNLTSEEKEYADLAAEVLDPLIKKDDAEACFQMATLVECGYKYLKGTEPMTEIQLLQIASDGGNERASRDLGLKYSDELSSTYNPERAIPYFKKCGKLKWYTAVRYAMCLMEAHKNQDCQLAFDIAKKALNGEFEDALSDKKDFYWIMGYGYFEGLGVERNVKTAIEFWSKNEFHYQSNMALSKLYHEGKEVEQDLEKAEEYASHANIAAIQEAHKEASKKLEEQISKEIKEARERALKESRAKIEEELKEERAKRELEKGETQRGSLIKPKGGEGKNDVSETELAERNAYAASVLSRVKLDINHIIHPHPYLMSQMKSAEVTDPVWNEMRKKLKAKDWLGFLNAMPYNRKTKFQTMPSKYIIDSSIRYLMRYSFDIVIVFGQSSVYDDLTVRKLLKWKEESYYSSSDIIRRHEEYRVIRGAHGPEALKISFKLDDCLMIGKAGVPFSDICFKYMGLERDIKAKKEIGKLSEEDFGKAIIKNREQFKEAILGALKNSQWEERKHKRTRR